MANIASAKKRIRQNTKRRARNRLYISRSRKYVKEARFALESGEYQTAEQAVNKATIELDRAASKGVIHRNNASRRISRLQKHLAALRQS